jgi:hypothetical protein
MHPTRIVLSKVVLAFHFHVSFAFLLQMHGQGVSVKDVNQHEFVKALAAFLKKYASWACTFLYC